MVNRHIKNNILTSLKHFPVVGVLGPRQVGKTTLAKEIQKSFKESVYIDLELASDFDKLQNAELYLKQHQEKLIILDEIQRMPTLFPLIRSLVDQKRVPARFLILGSASPTLIRQASESLAGRIKYHELTPFTFQEVMGRNGAINQLWARGGYPDSFLSNSEEISFSWRQAFIRTYLEKDIPQFGIRVPALQLRRFWTMLAHNHAQLWNASQIANSLGQSAPTIKHYLDILHSSFIIRQLQPYFANVKKRIVKSPKIYIRDSGLLHAILNLGQFEQIQDNPIVGASWEGFVVEQIINMLPENREVYFYRTSSGAELDLIIPDQKKGLIAFEIKYSLSPKPTKGFWNALDDLDCKQAYIIYPGQESYPISENVTVVPIFELMGLRI